MSFKNFVDNCFIGINNIKNLPNVFLRSISEIIIVTNLKLHTFLKHVGCPRGEEGDQIWTMMDKRGRGVKNINILSDVLCKWPRDDSPHYLLFELHSTRLKHDV